MADPAAPLVDQDPRSGRAEASGAREGEPGTVYRDPAEAALDTAEEQARALLHDLRESFAPSYLTLISVIEGVLLGLTFELVAERHLTLRPDDPSILLALNNIIMIALVWNE